MIKIVSYKICPFVQRVTAVLEAKSIPYDLEYISLRDKPQWFLDASPTGQVPILITEEGETLFESDAIVEYIDDVSAALEPALTPEQRAKNRAWSYQGSKHYLVQCPTMMSSTKELFEERKVKLIKAFEKAENQIESGPFFNGENLSNVDIAWIPLLHRAAIVEEKTGFDFTKGFPKVKAWQKALLDTGIPQKSVSEDFVEAFSNSYLSEKTYLGSLTR